MIIPEKLKKNINETFGSSGQMWLNNLPSYLEKALQYWDLIQVDSIKNLSFNYVTIVEHKTYGLVILKLSYPGETNNEILNFDLNLPGYRRCLDVNRELNAVLLEYIDPGVPLNTIENHKKEWVITLKSLKNRVLTNSSLILPHHREWCYKTFSKTEDIPEFISYINRAKQFINDLDRKYNSTYINHGDFHYENIIYNRESDSWVLIDPQPVYGYIFSDLGRFLLNLILRTEFDREILDQALSWYSEHLSIALNDLRKMVYIEMVLANSWTLEGDVKRSPIFEDLQRYQSILVEV